jgi:hypothetical protein
VIAREAVISCLHKYKHSCCERVTGGLMCCRVTNLFGFLKCCSCGPVHLQPNLFCLSTMVSAGSCGCSVCFGRVVACVSGSLWAALYA